MLHKVLYTVLLIIFLIRFYYPTRTIINLSMVTILTVLSLIILGEENISESVVVVFLLMMVGLYRAKFYWVELNDVENNVWSYPWYIILASISLGCGIILINDNYDLLNMVQIVEFTELPMATLFIISFLYVRIKVR
jgi:hypothetical protein